MLWAHVLLVGLLVGTEAFFTGLSERNLRHARDRLAAAAPEELDALGVDDPGSVADYHRDRSRLGALEAWTMLGAVLLLLYGGVIYDLELLVFSLGLGPLVTGVVFLVGLSLLLAVVHLPFAAAGTFVVEERYGFNEQSPAEWLRDRALQLALGLVVATLAVGGLLFVLAELPRWWWLAGAGLYVAFVLVAQIVYPRWIAPLFHEFEPVEDGPLRDAVVDVLETAGLEFDGIYVMDASTRTAHANAYFVGFGDNKRIVLYDTMIDSMEVPEIQAVLAHELAHWDLGHVWRNVAVGTASVALTLLAVDVLMGWSTMFALFDLPGAPHLGLLLAAVWLAPVRRLAGPLTSRWSRRHERQADDYAVDVVGDGEALADALVELSSTNLSNPYPDPLYAAFHHSHPPMGERVERLRGA